MTFGDLLYDEEEAQATQRRCRETALSLDEEFKILTWEYFGEELRRARLTAGLTQAKLGSMVFVSASYIAQFEIGQRKPQLDVAERLDGVLDTGGSLSRLVAKLIRKSSGLAEYFTRVVALEAEATEIREYEATAVPGLLQIAEYARAVARAGQRFAPDGVVEEIVTARLKRSAILADATRPKYWVVLHEAALRVTVGGGAVMSRQLSHVASMAHKHIITVQVLPHSIGAHAAMGRPFRLMDFEDTPPIGYTEGLLSGNLMDDPQMVKQLQDIYDLLRADALSPAASLDAIESAAEEYRTWNS